MTMSKDDCFKAALKMIQVTTENYKDLKAGMILHVCKIIADAEEQLQQEESDRRGPNAEIMTF